MRKRKEIEEAMRRMHYWHTEAPFSLPCPFCGKNEGKRYNLVRCVVTCLACKKEIEVKLKL